MDKATIERLQAEVKTRQKEEYERVVRANIERYLENIKLAKGAVKESAERLEKREKEYADYLASLEKEDKV